MPATEPVELTEVDGAGATCQAATMCSATDDDVVACGWCGSGYFSDGIVLGEGDGASTNAHLRTHAVTLTAVALGTFVTPWVVRLPRRRRPAIDA